MNLLVALAVAGRPLAGRLGAAEQPELHARPPFVSAQACDHQWLRRAAAALRRSPGHSKRLADPLGVGGQRLRLLHLAGGGAQRHALRARHAHGNAGGTRPARRPAR